MKKAFSIGRPEREGAVQADQFVAGSEAETTKTFRLPVSLSRALKVHAARTGQKEKDILIRLIEDYLQEHS